MLKYFEGRVVAIMPGMFDDSPAEVHVLLHRVEQEKVDSEMIKFHLPAKVAEAHPRCIFVGERTLFAAQPVVVVRQDGDVTSASLRWEIVSARNLNRWGW